MMMKMIKDSFDGWFGMKLFLWNNIIERYFSSWLEEYAEEWVDNHFDKVEVTPLQYEDLD